MANCVVDSFAGLACRKGFELQIDIGRPDTSVIEDTTMAFIRAHSPRPTGMDTGNVNVEADARGGQEGEFSPDFTPPVRGIPYGYETSTRPINFICLCNTSQS